MRLSVIPLYLGVFFTLPVPFLSSLYPLPLLLLSFLHLLHSYLLSMHYLHLFHNFFPVLIKFYDFSLFFHTFIAFTCSHLSSHPLFLVFTTLTPFPTPPLASVYRFSCLVLQFHLPEVYVDRLRTEGEQNRCEVMFCG